MSHSKLYFALLLNARSDLRNSHAFTQWYREFSISLHFCTRKEWGETMTLRGNINLRGSIRQWLWHSW